MDFIYNDLTLNVISTGTCSWAEEKYINYYCPRMWEGHVIKLSVSLSDCLCACLCFIVYLSVNSGYNISMPQYSFSVW